jgi:hypothetical protein
MRFETVEVLREHRVNAGQNGAGGWPKRPH